MSSEKKYLSTAQPGELAEFIQQSGESRFRAGQIYGWVTKKWVTDPDSMTNLTVSTKNIIRESFIVNAVALLREDTASDGSKKMLLRLLDGETVECATIPAEDGRLTFCLSSQVGCPVRCAFCASGACGFTRNLDAGEIVEEFLLLCRHFGQTPDNIVMMGVGEPLLNYSNLIEALETICNPDGIGVAQRRVTISTSGWVPGIRQLAKHGRQWNLAVSMHGPDDKTRSILIPQKYRCDIKEILRACAEHREATGRLLTFEYVLLAGVNDSKLQAQKFARLAGDAKAKVNLIPYNKANGAFERPSRDVIKQFENALKTLHIPVTTRVEKGADSHAACGQLRASYHAAKKTEQVPGKDLSCQ